MNLEVGYALVAGVLAGLAMAVPLLVATARGTPLQLDMLRLWGTLRRSGLPPTGAGMVIHVVVSALVGLVYGVGFDVLGADDHLWVWGLLGGAVHWLIAGVVLAGLASVHPDMPAVLAAPGAYCRKLGRADVIAFAAAHFSYGLAFATLYAALYPGGGARLVI